MDFDLLLRTSALLLTAFAATRVLRRTTAATRHLIWHAAVMTTLLAPAASVVAPRFSVSVPRWTEASLRSLRQSPSLVEHSVQPSCATSGSDVCASTTTRENPIGIDAISWLASTGTWILGGWFLLGWLASGWQVAQAGAAPTEWINDTRRLAARLGLRDVPRIRQARDAGSPRVAGFLRPVILLPALADRWTSADREAALVHELSHIKRADRRTQALAQLACALYWFNPLVWLAARELARERERACDDEVLRAGIRPSAYASLLLDLAKGTHAWTPAAALGMARPSTIEGRLLAILSIDSTTTTSRRLRARRATRWFVVTGSVVVAAAMLGAQQVQLGARTNRDSAFIGPPLMQIEERTNPSSLMQALTRALDDPDQDVREHAAMGLALIPGSDTVEPLLIALGDSDAQVREKAAIGLAFRRDARIVDPLLKAMDDRNAQVREKVAIALGASGDPRAQVALEKALDDPSSQVREKAVSGLILLGLRK